MKNEGFYYKGYKFASKRIVFFIIDFISCNFFMDFPI